MPDTKKVVKGLECCRITDNDISCTDCPYNDPVTFKYGENGCLREKLMPDAIVLLKEQEKIIAKYRKADSFLNAHGWKWERVKSE